MPKQKKRRKGFTLKVGAIFENLDDTIEITKIEQGVFYTLTSKHGLPTFHTDSPFGVIRNVLKADKYKQLI